MIVWTNGCFNREQLHEGHKALLDFVVDLARVTGGEVFIGLNSDSSVRSLKGIERAIPWEKREQNILNYLGTVIAWPIKPIISIIKIQNEEDLEKRLAWIKPYFLVKGADTLKGYDKIVGEEYAKYVVLLKHSYLKMWSTKPKE